MALTAFGFGGAGIALTAFGLGGAVAALNALVSFDVLKARDMARLVMPTVAIAMIIETIRLVERDIFEPFE